MTAFEPDIADDAIDPDETPISGMKLITQPYDLGVQTLIDQIKSGAIYLRPLTERPYFQRRYVWNDSIASKLIESILLNVPIPSMFFSQNDDMELDVIDGQQRMYTIYRFINNQFKLRGLDVLKQLNGFEFFKLSSKDRNKIMTHPLRCVVITNESHPEMKFEVFQRLNTNTVPLNAQELRNCVYRGPLNNLLEELSFHEPWLEILGRKAPDKRLRDEEQILRFFAFELLGLENYRTPQKRWLNDAAKSGMRFNSGRIAELENTWKRAVERALSIFEPDECFRRPDRTTKKTAPNRALMDVLLHTLAGKTDAWVKAHRTAFRRSYARLNEDPIFDDLISRAVDHRKRLTERFTMWDKAIAAIG